MIMAFNAKRKITTGKVRLSYANLFEPKAPINGEGDPQYSVCILIPKEDAETVAAIKEAIKAAHEDGLSRFFNGKKLPASALELLHDGDEKDDPAYEGHWFMNTKTKEAPKIVDRNLQPIIDPDEVYSGCYGRVSVIFNPYNIGNVKKGIRAKLLAVQKVADGERFGSVYDASRDFDVVSDKDFM